MAALAATGQEGALRAQYVDQLQASEEQLKAPSQHEVALKGEIERLKQEFEAMLRLLAWMKKPGSPQEGTGFFLVCSSVLPAGTAGNTGSCLAFTAP
jgi:hypothetical protein